MIESAATQITLAATSDKSRAALESWIYSFCVDFVSSKSQAEHAAAAAILYIRLASSLKEVVK